MTRNRSVRATNNGERGRTDDHETNADKNPSRLTRNPRRGDERGDTHDGQQERQESHAFSQLDSAHEELLSFDTHDGIGEFVGNESPGLGVEHRELCLATKIRSAN